MGSTTGSAEKRYMKVSSIVATTDKVEGKFFCLVGIKVVVPLSEGSLKSQDRTGLSGEIVKCTSKITTNCEYNIPFAVIADCCYFFFINIIKTVILHELCYLREWTNITFSHWMIALDNFVPFLICRELR